MEHLLVAERLIHCRLEERLPQEVAIMSAADLVGVSAQAQITPAIHILYDGYSIADEIADGAITMIEQRWLVVVAVRNVRDNASGQATREDAGPLLSLVLSALLGWRPSTEHSALKLGVAPAPVYDAGFGYFPLTFSTRLTARGD